MRPSGLMQYPRRRVVRIAQENICPSLHEYCIGNGYITNRDKNKLSRSYSHCANAAIKQTLSARVESPCEYLRENEPDDQADAEEKHQPGSRSNQTPDHARVP